ncbi:MAG TPA: TolC family protein [Verrucomicrobiae bacterium]|nr:TolC family protein [Verrucomicrobiae bacterium]
MNLIKGHGLKSWLAILGMALLAGCVRFQSKPLVPEQNAVRLESRSLTNAALKTFLENNLHREIADWPHPLWDFDMLTLAAFYYHPSLEVARAQWQVARAGIKTAGERPNPTLSVIPGYSMNPAAMESPWLPAINLDIPIETAGKRGKRMSQAEHLSEVARLNVATAAWQVRSGVRSSLIDSAAAQQRVELFQQQVALQQDISGVFKQQAEVGAIATSELATMRVAAQKAQLDLINAQGDATAARSHLAEAIGVPFAALDEVTFSFDPLNESLCPTNLDANEVRDVALRSRTDILGALAEYAASEDALRLEIARQYPDVHLNPGYQFDQGEHKWTLGISVELPLLNHNQGPVAEAQAQREASAAKFNALQASVLAEIDRAIAACDVNGDNSAVLRSLVADSEKKRASAEAQYKAGELERLEFLNAQLEAITAKLVFLDGQSKLQQASAALEDAIQRPLSGTIFSAEISPAKKENTK